VGAAPKLARVSTEEHDDATAAADGAVYQVGEVAERVRLSHRTVRYYDDQGLLSAARSAGNYRLYSESDIQRMLTIRRMKPLGFSLDEMRHVLAVLDRVDREGAQAPELELELRRAIDDVRERRDKLAEQMAGADDFLAALRARLP
jgi:DNA-binding transcriptional MerR regulator